MEPIDERYLEPTPPIPDSEEEQQALAGIIEKAVRQLRKRGQDVTLLRDGNVLVPLEWIANFVRCTPERSTTDRIRASLAWTRGADLEATATVELLPLLDAVNARLAASSPDVLAALIRSSGPALLPLVSVNVGLLPVLKRAANDTRTVLARERELQAALIQTRRALSLMEQLTGFRRCERCRVNVPLYLSDDASCTQSYHSGRYYNFSEETRRGGWACCGATSKTAKGCRGRDYAHPFVEGAETLSGLSRETVALDEAGLADAVLADPLVSDLAERLHAVLTQRQGI